MNTKRGTEIIVLQEPLEAGERPKGTTSAYGRFIAISSKFLDPVIIQKKEVSALFPSPHVPLHPSISPAFLKRRLPHKSHGRLILEFPPSLKLLPRNAVAPLSVMARRITSEDSPPI
jgi:hypothetical protein